MSVKIDVFSWFVRGSRKRGAAPVIRNERTNFLKLRVDVNFIEIFGQEFKFSSVERRREISGRRGEKSDPGRVRTCTNVPSKRCFPFVLSSIYFSLSARNEMPGTCSKSASRLFPITELAQRFHCN